jgi:hypothetical protein
MPNSNKKPALDRFLIAREILVIQGVSVALVAFSPADILSRQPALARFVAIVADWIPPISAYQRVSEFPEVCGFYFSVMFLITPVLLLYSWRTRGYALQCIATAAERRPLVWNVTSIASIGFCLIMPLVLYLWANGSEVFPLMPLRSSKVSLAIFGWIAAGGVGWLLLPHGICVAVIFLKTRIIKQRK